MNAVVEICAGSYEDALAAQAGGASRIELNSALSVGGLTPTPAVLRRIKADTNLEVICMVRPRAAGFAYSDLEKQIMFQEARDLLEAGADGLAFGFLKADGTIDEKAVASMNQLIHSYGKTAVFHRAFDVTPDAHQAMTTLIALGSDRVLTSGQQEKACQGAALIHDLQEHFGDQIEILAGSGINADNVQWLLENTGIHQVHASCRGYGQDLTTMGNGVSYAYLADPFAYEKTDRSSVEVLCLNSA